MKKKDRVGSWIIMLLLVTNFGCQKDKIPGLSTNVVTGITAISAISGGTITDEGSGTIITRGVCWSTNITPSVADNKTQDGAGAGSFISNISGLIGGTTYYVRAYATNNTGTGYGMAMSFTSQPATIPVLTTSNISDITQNSAICGGTITSDGAASITARGVCWNTSANPTIANSKTTNDIGIGVFTSSITGLTLGTTYYVRAYATNSTGTAYGNQIVFTTINIPTLTTTAVSAKTQTTASSGGNISNDGGASIIVRGLCWNTLSNPTTANSKTTDGTGTEAFTSSITGLTAGTTYFARAYASNSVGTAYGNEIVFTTINVPTLITTEVSAITGTTAISGGNVTDNGNANIIARGVCWSTSANPTTTNSKTIDGIGNGIFTSSIAGLILSTTYFVRAYATNSAGTSYGNEIIFTTTNVPISLTTASISLITQTSGKSGGNVTSDGGATITARGVCWGISANPTTSDSKTIDGTGSGVFTSSITGLNPNTKYFVRAYATNSLGTSYGDELILKTYTGTVTDIDGNIYNTVTIGTQEWMVENLKTTKYADGTLILLVNSTSTWDALPITSNAYCWFNDNISNKDSYGALYNWSAAMNGATSSTTKPSGVQGVCPAGWHLPSVAEWTELETYLGGQNITGGKMKEAGTTHWASPNTGATNESGFSGLPGGFRYHTGQFAFFTTAGYWWSTTESSTTNAYGRFLGSDFPSIQYSGNFKKAGSSVRCLKN
jgi:uncharacterized protein (TIGR02145 family)